VNMCLLAYNAFLFSMEDTLCLNVPSFVNSDNCGGACDVVTTVGIIDFFYVTVTLT
jgi:hypothetical protein